MDGTRKKKPERQTWYVILKWILDVNQRINRVKSIAADNLGNKEDLKRDTGISWESELDEISLVNWGRSGMEGSCNERDILIEGGILG